MAPGGSGNLVTGLLMFFNFTVSVVIIWANKIAFNLGFKWATALTALHFLFTFAGLEVCSQVGMFEKKRIPITGVLPICFAFCGFVVFNNLSLQYNAVGLYQLLKVMTTPTIVFLQYVLPPHTTIPLKTAISLIPVCVGVTLASVTHLEANFWGSVFGVAGIFSTSLYQIWVKTQQAELKVNGQQLLYYQAPVSMVLLLIIMPFVEDIWGPEGLLSYRWTWLSFGMVIVTGLLAFLVNLSIYLVIGKTSPVSYNVLGHAKLCTILTSGFLFFGEKATAKSVAGIILAVIGFFFYTHLQLSGTSKNEKKEEKSDSRKSSNGAMEMQEVGSSTKERS